MVCLFNSFHILHSFAMSALPSSIVERLMRHQPRWDFSRWSGRQFKLIIRRPTMAGRFHGDEGCVSGWGQGYPPVSNVATFFFARASQWLGNSPKNMESVQKRNITEINRIFSGTPCLITGWYTLFCLRLVTYKLFHVLFRQLQKTYSYTSFRCTYGIFGYFWWDLVS